VYLRAVGRLFLSRHDMEGLRRSIERGAVVTTNGNASWQKPAIAGLWALVILFAGWMWNMNEASQKAAEAAQKAAAAKTDAAIETVHQTQERIATLEEAVRGLTRSLDRIEAGVDELRRGEPKREPRR
jgi:type VI protein secretion system component VasK